SQTDRSTGGARPRRSPSTARAEGSCMLVTTRGMRRDSSNQDEEGSQAWTSLQQVEAPVALRRQAREVSAVASGLVGDARGLVADDARAGMPAAAGARAGAALGTGQPFPSLRTRRADEFPLVEGLLGQANAEGAVAQADRQAPVGDRLAAGHAVAGVTGVAGA